MPESLDGTRPAQAGAGTIPNFWWVNQGVISHLGGDFTFLWASLKDVSNRSQPHWDSLEDVALGDVVLHYARGHVVGRSVVARVSRPTIRPAAFEVGDRVGDLGREVFLNRLQLFDIPVALAEIPLTLRKSELGEGGPFTRAGKVQGGYFFPINQAAAVAVFGAAGLVVDGQTKRADPFVADDSAEDGEMFLDITGTAGTAVVRYRKDHSGLRALLFGGRSSFQCGICGWSYPVRYLRTSYIKSMSACTEDERKDWRNVVMAACAFGCDALFEDRMLRVDATGKIQLEAGHDETPAFALFTKSLSGKLAPAFRDENRAYFEWRNAETSASLVE